MSPRVPGRTVVGVGELNPFPGNARIHDDDLLDESLEELGQYRSVVVNKGTHTGRPNEILCGNGTYERIKARGDKTIKVEWVDVDDATATQINLIDNHANDRATNDEAKVRALVESLDESQRWMLSEAELDKLFAAADDGLDTEPQLGEMEYRVIVECRDEAQQRDLLERLEAEGLECRAVMS